MHHPRPDWNRIQDPATSGGELLALLEDIRKADLNFGIIGDVIRDRVKIAIEKQRASMVVGEGCTPIGEDEPVFMVRGQDKHLVPMVRKFKHLVHNDPGCLAEQKTAIEKQLNEHIEYAAAWQKKHGKKSPDVPLAADEAGE